MLLIIRRAFGPDVLPKRAFQLALALGLSFVLVSGPTVQLIATAIIADGSSIYSSIYGEAIAPFPTWSSWLAGGLHPQYVLCALATVLASGQGRRPATFILWGATVAAFGLTLIDLVWGGLEGIGVSLVCNLLGGLMIAGAVFTIASVACRLKLAPCRYKVGAIVAIMVWPVTAGLIISFSLYVVFRMLLHPTPVQVFLDAEVPFNGYYSTDYDSECHRTSLSSYRPVACASDSFEQGISVNGSRESKKFALLDLSKRTSGLRFIGKAEPLVVDWKRTSFEPTRASIRLVQGCVDSLKEMDEKGRALPDAQANEHLRLILEEGMLQLQPLSNRSISDVHIEEAGLAQFSVGYVDGQEGRLKVSRFLSEAKVTMRPSITGGSLVVLMFPANAPRESNDDGFVAIEVMHDEIKSRVLLEQIDRIEPDSPVACLPIRFEDGIGRLELPVIGVLIDVIGPKQIQYSKMEELSQFVVENFNGWGGVDAIAASDLEYFAQDGGLGMIHLNAGYSKLKFDREEIASSSRSLVSLHGDLHASIRSSTLTVTGEAVSAHLDGQRMNRTRWEKLDGTVRTGLLTALPGLLLLYWQKLRVFFSRNRDVWKVVQ